MRTPLTLILLLFLFLGKINAQVNVKDSAQAAWIIPVSLSYHFPLGDNADRFENNMGLSIGLTYKFQSGILIGANAMYLFGNDVKLRESILKSVGNERGQIIGITGELAEVETLQRGYYFGATVGKIWRVLDYNRNSGLITQVGAGFLRNRIFFVDDSEIMPQYAGDYEKGYDRLHYGLGTYQYIGYYHLGNNRGINFTVGVESLLGFTKNRRGYNYDTQMFDRASKIDWYVGLKFGWLLPIYNKNTQKYYYY